MAQLEFDFTTQVDRSDKGSSKWLGAPQPVREAKTTPLSVADMELPVAPCIENAVVQAARGGAYGYTEADAEYLDSVASWQLRRNGWRVEPDWIVTTPGVVTALKLSVRAFTQPGEKVIVQPPVYYPFIGGVKQCGREVVENPLRIDGDGRYRFDFADLEEKAADPAAKVLLLCSPENPTGRVWERAELEQLSRICIDNDVLVVADEIHSDLIVGDVPFTPYATVSKEAHGSCVVCTAVSKTFNLAGLCNSNIIIPNGDVRKRFAERASIELPWGIPYFSRAATIAAYTEGEPWLSALVDLVRGNDALLRQVLLEGIPGLWFSKLEGTYLPWSDWRALGMSVKELSAFMSDEALTALDDGWLFGTGGAGFMRFNVAAPRDTVLEAAQRIVAAAKAHGLA